MQVEVCFLRKSLHLGRSYRRGDRASFNVKDAQFLISKKCAELVEKKPEPVQEGQLSVSQVAQASPQTTAKKSGSGEKKAKAAK